MKLHTNRKLFQDAIIATAQRQNIKEIFIEKDYWVTLILKAVFENEIGKQVVFKGGTALSKCNSLIKRFSEDIDFVVLRNPKETGNQLKNTYLGNFKELVYGEFPNEFEILETIKIVAERLTKVEWKII